MTSRPRSVSSELRVTIRPAESEIRNAGTWLTRPSPMVSLVKTLTASAEAHPVVDDAEEQPGADVDQGDDDARDGVAPDELAGPVHRPEEVGLAIDGLAAAVGLVLVDQAGVEVGVDRHLAAGQAVEHEPGGDLADPRGPPGDHDELDHDEDREQDRADDHLVARDELAERPDHAAGRVEALVPPWVRTSRVVATLSTSRVSVVVRRMVGKALKSVGERIARVVSSTSTASVMLAAWSRSSTAGGTGTMKTRIAPTIVTGRTTPARRVQVDEAAEAIERGRHPFLSSTRGRRGRPNRRLAAPGVLARRDRDGGPSIDRSS